MSIKEEVLGPIVTMINTQLGRNYGIDDFVILPVTDSLVWKNNTSSNTSAEKRCLYDFVTIDPKGVHLRMEVKPDKLTTVQPMVVDTYTVDDANTDRTTFSSTVRLNASEAELEYDSGRCPDLSLIFLDGCTLLATEQGHIIEVDGAALLAEQSNC